MTLRDELAAVAQRRRSRWIIRTSLNLCLSRGDAQSTMSKDLRLIDGFHAAPPDALDLAATQRKRRRERPRRKKQAEDAPG